METWRRMDAIVNMVVMDSAWLQISFDATTSIKTTLI